MFKNLLIVFSEFIKIYCVFCRFKNNIRLEEGDKYQFIYDEDTNTFELQINDVTKSDDGSYRCKIDNGFGSSSQECELCVQLKTGYVLNLFST